MKPYLREILRFIGVTDVTFIQSGSTWKVDNGSEQAEEHIAPLIAQVSDPSGPFVLVDRSVIVIRPLTARKVAEALGIHTNPMKKDYDVVVVGGGPLMDERSGHASFPYAARHTLNRVMANVPRAKYPRHTGFEQERWAGFFPNAKSLRYAGGSCFDL